MNAPSRIEIRHWLATETREQIVKRLENIKCPDTREDVRDFLNLENKLHKASMKRGGTPYKYKQNKSSPDKEGEPYSLVPDGEHSLYLEHQDAQRRLRADKNSNSSVDQIPEDVRAIIQAMEE